MTPTLTPPLAALYEADETAWLEAMARLAAARRADEFDFDHLAEYLSDMARSDRRQVESRLAVLFAHLLKWDHQPDRRSRSWLLTIEQQRQELRRLLASGTLRNHAEATLAEVCADAVRQAAIETGLPVSRFPADCPFGLLTVEDETSADELPVEE